MSVDEASAPRLRPRLPGPIVVLVGASMLGGCGEGIPEAYRPDAVLQAELGLTDDDEVHRVSLTGAEGERADPDSVAVHGGAWVEFYSADWRVHEIRFELDSLGPAARSFLEETDQVESPPLVDRGARFLVHLDGAPPGRYPYALEGNGGPGRGVVVVVANP